MKYRFPNSGLGGGSVSPFERGHDTQTVSMEVDSRHKDVPIFLLNAESREPIDWTSVEPDDEGIRTLRVVHDLTHISPENYQQYPLETKILLPPGWPEYEATPLHIDTAFITSSSGSVEAFAREECTWSNGPVFINGEAYGLNSGIDALKDVYSALSAAGSISLGQKAEDSMACLADCYEQLGMVDGVNFYGESRGADLALLKATYAKMHGDMDVGLMVLNDPTALKDRRSLRGLVELGVWAGRESLAVGAIAARSVFSRDRGRLWDTLEKHPSRLAAYLGHSAFGLLTGQAGPGDDGYDISDDTTIRVLRQGSNSMSDELTLRNGLRGHPQGQVGFMEYAGPHLGLLHVRNRDDAHNAFGAYNLHRRYGEPSREDMEGVAAGVPRDVYYFLGMKPA